MNRLGSRFHVTAALAAILAVSGGGTLYAAENKSEGKDAPAKVAQPPAPVRVGAVRRADVPITVNTIGRVEPLMRVNIQSQVAGQVDAVLFQEGQHVKKGDVLVRIDPRPYQARYNELQAKVDQDRAAEKNASWNYERYKSLRDSGAITESDLHRYQTDAESAVEAVKGSQAALASAKLQIDYCTVTSPIDGRAGEKKIDAGNVVKANEGSGFTELIQVAPIWVSFSVPERYFSQIRDNQAKGALIVTAQIGGNAEEMETGELTFIDNQVNPDTGTIRMKGRFANEKEKLWPGQFVTTSLEIALRKDALIVPLTAIQATQQGSVVYVVNDQSKVEIKKVKVLDTLASEAVVEGDLTESDRVVTDGQLRITTGGMVKILDDKNDVAVEKKDDKKV